MDTSGQQSTKQLKEHLQHHQEPFSLQSYLIERSYMFNNNLSYESTNIHHLSSAKNLKSSIKYDLHKIRKRLLHATGILRSLLFKFIPTEDSQFSNWVEEDNNDLYYVHEYLTAHTQPTQQTSSLKTLAMSHHFTKNDAPHHKVLPANMFQTFTLPKLKRSEVDAGTEPYWIRSKENSQQCSRGPKWKASLPNAVCHLKSSDEQVTAVPTLSQKLVRDYVRKLAASSNILKLRRAKKDKLQEMVETASLCGRIRRSLAKREQLRFDRVEKDKGFHENEGKSVSSKAVAEAEGFQSIIHEHFNVLEKQYREAKRIRHLLHAESCVISEEWKSFQILNLEICMEIGDSITDDIVSEIIDFF
ncbi:hypothetical protein VIGAN_10246400 [Vigna angularis var. angularis]|uniref:DUF4378 domain-containing protein n=1 Tax=Vigna angularis var. angularis TaxID=157739 RepID=A0A0S3T6G0_PHAAN|nr:uncharacterized protein LOC128194340 [Vigna angularis]BAU00830.1 hypothetical protein VIGAN_10246400 [Vigna angularis var. angularis]